jgi:hypothetical protein
MGLLTNLFGRKRTVYTKPVREREQFDLHLRAAARPNWDKIQSDVDAQRYGDRDLDAFWTAIAFDWLNEIAESWRSMHIEESEHFLMLSPQARAAKAAIRYAERVYSTLEQRLAHFSGNEGYGKVCIIAFEDEDQYYEYMSAYNTEDGEYAASAGVYINEGYGHFVFVQADQSAIESIIAHELTHCFLAHLPIPAWLNEGIAVTMEHTLVPQYATPITRNLERHRVFWNAETIQEFWSGKSFLRADEGHELSYELASFFVATLAKDNEAFVEFVRNASGDDSGQSALRVALNIELATLPGSLFGFGDWTPKPTKWRGIEHGAFR